MAPNSVLLEIGTHTNTLEAAQNGAKEFADVLPQFLGLKAVKEENTAPKDQTETVDSSSGGMGKAIMILLLVVLLGGGGYFLISQGKGKV